VIAFDGSRDIHDSLSLCVDLRLFNYGLPDGVKELSGTSFITDNRLPLERTNIDYDL